MKPVVWLVRLSQQDLRWRPVTPYASEATQTASAPGRYMFEAVVTSTDVVKHAASAGLDMAMILTEGVLRKAFACRRGRAGVV